MGVMTRENRNPELAMTRPAESAPDPHRAVATPLTELPLPSRPQTRAAQTPGEGALADGASRSRSERQETVGGVAARRVTATAAAPPSDARGRAARVQVTAPKPFAVATSVSPPLSLFLTGSSCKDRKISELRHNEQTSRCAWLRRLPAAT